MVRHDTSVSKTAARVVSLPTATHTSSNLAVEISNDREVNLRVGILDGLHPLRMCFRCMTGKDKDERRRRRRRQQQQQARQWLTRIDAQADDDRIALLKLRLHLDKCQQLLHTDTVAPSAQATHEHTGRVARGTYRCTHCTMHTTKHATASEGTL